MEQLVPLLVGLVSSVLVEGAKRFQSFPVWKGETAKLRLLLGALVIGGNILAALLQGNLDSLVSSESSQLALGSAISWLVGHLTYKLGLKQLN